MKKISISNVHRYQNRRSKMALRNTLRKADMEEPISVLSDRTSGILLTHWLERSNRSNLLGLE